MAFGLNYLFYIWNLDSYCYRDEGEWDNLTPAQRESRERSFQNMMLLARFHNTLGSHTIQILIFLTKEVSWVLFILLSLIDKMYHLFAIINHIGRMLSHGCYTLSFRYDFTDLCDYHFNIFFFINLSLECNHDMS